MKVKVTGKIAISKVDDLLSILACNCEENFEISPAGWLQERTQYCVPRFKVSQEGETSFSGTTCEGNSVLVVIQDTGIFFLEYEGTRHALHEFNSAGEIFLRLFYRIDSTGRYYIPTPALTGAMVTEYSSWRKDANWYEYGLEPLLFGKDYARAKAEGRV